MRLIKSKNLLLLSASVFLAAVYGSCSAQDKASDLATVIGLAVRNNPEITAYEKKYEAASARIPQAGGLKDPTIAYEHDRVSADRMLSGGPMDVYSVSQELPFPSKIYLRAKIDLGRERKLLR
jgi:hypothetical protein